MSDISLKERMSHVRSKCEELFFMVLPYVPIREDAEKLAQVAAKNHYLDTITVHEEYIRTSEGGKNYSNYDLGKNYVNGIRAAHEARIISHQSSIAELKKNIELIDANIL